MGLFSGIGSLAGSFFGGPAGGTIGGTIGGILDSASDAKSARDQNRGNIAMSREQMAFQREMSNTAHQREVADLKKAGLNPMLSGMGGSGASVPPGAMARIENTASSTSSNSVNNATAQLVRAQTETAETQAALNSASAAKVSQDTRAAAAGADLAEFQAEQLGANKELASSTYQRELGLRHMKAFVDRLKQENDRDTLSDLNGRAQKLGYFTIDSAMKDQEFRQYANDLYQSKLKNAEFESFSGMYHSDYGKNVAPYVNSASGIAGSVSGLSGAMRNLRNLKRK